MPQGHDDERDRDRLPITIYKVALGPALEALQRPKAKEAQGTRTDLKPSVPSNEKSRTERFDTREVVARLRFEGVHRFPTPRARELLTAAHDGDAVADLAVTNDAAPTRGYSL